MKCFSKKVLCDGLVLAVFLLVMIISSVPLVSQASASRFEQIDKSEALRDAAIHRQTISCEDFDSDIEQVTVSLQATGNDLIGYKAIFVKPGERTDIVTPAVASRTSNDLFIGPRYEKRDYTFMFPEAVSVSELCSDTTYATLHIMDTGNHGLGLRSLIFGSFQNPYSGGSYLNLQTDTADAYFIINGHTSNKSGPILGTIGNQITAEGSTLQFNISASDQDNDILSFSVSNLPLGAALNPTTGEFSWTPTYNDAGTYEMTFTVTEDTSEGLSDSETMTITVNNVNRASALGEIGNKTINEGDILEFAVTASDPDGDSLILSAANLPVGSSFDPASGIFTWNTTYSDAGNYTDIEFAATDDGEPMEVDVELVTITVGDINRPPELNNPGPQSVLEGQTLSFNVTATDRDGDNFALSVGNSPSGASFESQTGLFTWNTTFSDAGVYNVTFIATDDGTPNEVGTIDVVITVGDDPTPVEQTENLIEDVIELDIPQNVENSYMANLQKVEQFILDGKVTAAINQLNAFTQKIKQDYQQNLLTQTEYNILFAAAENLIDDLMGV